MSMKKVLMFTLLLALALPATAQWTDRGNAKLIWGTSITAQTASDDGKCLSYDLATSKVVWKACVASETDGVVGNEVTNATNATLTRSGSGTAGSPYTLGLTLSNANTWTAAISVLRAGIETTITDGVAVTNTTASTAGVTVQYSPSVRWEGHSWQTSGPSDIKHEWYAYVVPSTGATTSSTFTVASAKDGAAATARLTVSSAGSVQASGFASASGGVFSLQSTGVALEDVGQYTWSSTGSYSGTNDTGLARAAAGRVRVSDASTGYGAIVLGANQVQLAGVKALADNVATGLADIAIAAGEFVAGEVVVTGTATDATDHQATTQRCSYSAVNKAATITTAIQCGTAATAASGGTVDAFTMTLAAGSGKVTLTLQMDSSLTTPTMTARYTILANSTNAVTRL